MICWISMRHVLLLLLLSLESQKVKARRQFSSFIPAPGDHLRSLSTQHRHRQKLSLRPSRSTRLYSANKNKSLLARGVGAIAVGAALIVLWSEYSVTLTGCGPVELSDTLERISYQAVIASSGVSWFTRIAFQKEIAAIHQDDFGLPESEVWVVRFVEGVSFLAVLGAFGALGSQYYNGAEMDGLSGIDIEMCKARHDFQALY